MPRDALVARIHIHESGDLESAQRFWLDVTGLRPEQFGNPTLKKHNPKTVRKNTGDDYHGCLRIDVRRSSELYRRIEGWASAVMDARLPSHSQARNPTCAPTYTELPGEDSNLC